MRGAGCRPFHWGCLQAILGDLNTQANSLARLSSNYCTDHMRWRTLGYFEAEIWDKHVLGCQCECWRKNPGHGQAPITQPSWVAASGRSGQINKQATHKSCTCLAAGMWSQMTLPNRTRSTRGYRVMVLMRTRAVPSPTPGSVTRGTQGTRTCRGQGAGVAM
jgi:hypothetical protein